MITPYQKIRKAIEKALNNGENKFIIYPYGEFGVLTKQILNDSFGITECYIVDNNLSKFNSNIKSLEFCKELDTSKYKLLFTCANPDIYEDARSKVTKYFTFDHIIEIFKKTEAEFKVEETKQEILGTKYGKYSYGPLCDHWLVESVGAFCSFAPGVDVVQNHAVDYISTHPFLYQDSRLNKTFAKTYQGYRGAPWYFENVKPKGFVRKLRKCKIGNDVWFGKNVLIVNGANIGNGVIAGAGAVITKDIPDYAVVCGVPARIIKYRYTEEQIQALNRIAWWEWPDEKIRENYDDFYKNIEEFIKKHDI